ncbi:MAG: DEAD/DEAH box helicase [Erysipelotrichaceae bacterium]|nr:DEAD/DEAH box helicase [Erysipelotrichaceae bacterium]
MKKIQPWQNRFYSRILERGRNYYREGRVSSLKEEDGLISARVSGVYSVKIRIDEDGRVMRMSCDCPYAAEGRNCKHEAAVLFACEKKSGQEEEKKIPVVRKVRPFADAYKEKQYFYDLHRLTADYEITAEKYERAMELIEEGKAQLIDMGTGYLEAGSEQILYAVVHIEERYRTIEAYAYLSHDELVRIACDSSSCDRFSGNSWYYAFRNKAEKKLCEHEIAVLIFLDEYIRKFDPGDHTDRDAMVFLENFTSDPIRQDSEETVRSTNVCLVPKLEYDGDGILKLGFRLGNEKLYIAKDLEALADAYRQQKVYELSAKARLDFGRFDFREEDRKYYDFIEKAVFDEKTREEIRGLDYNAGKDARFFSVGKDILLYGQRLDEFYELCNDKRIEFNDKSASGKGRGEIVLAQGTPKTSLTVSEKNSSDGFIGVNVSGQLPELIAGSSYGYFLKDGVLYRADSDYMSLIRSLQRSLHSDTVDLTIGKKQLGRFYHHVLPRLKQQFEVFENNKELYERYIPPRPSFDFYFDVNEGSIFCMAKVSYADKEYDLFADDHDAQADMIMEKEAMKILHQVFHDRNEKMEFFVEGGDDIIFEILEDLIPQLLKIGDVHTTSSFDRLKVKRRTNLNVGVRVDNGLLDLDIDSQDISTEELAAVVNSYRLRKKYHKLKNGDLVRTDDENIETLSELLSSMNISLKDFVKGKMHLPVYRALYLDKILEANEGISDDRDVYFRKLIKDFKTIKESDHRVPEHLETVMRGYQKAGYRWLKTLSHFGFGGILADEMGLGKTLQMLALLSDNKNNGGKTSLIVCPASLVYNWLSEIRRFTPELKAAAVAGSQAERVEIIADHEAYDILVTSYDLLKRDIASYEDMIFDYEILDEAQYIKTYTTANARSCKAIQAKGHFALTGTPIENNLAELWSIFDFLMPGFLYGYEAFRERFEARIAREGDEEASKRLKDMIAPFILRRKKADVLADLPDKIEEIIRVRFDEKQRKLYDSQVLKVSKIVGSDEVSYEHNKIAVLAELMKLRQVCCEPGLIYEDFDGESAKRQACLELIKSAILEGHKILLFSQFTSMLEIIGKQLKKEEIPYYTITGATKKEERLKLVEAFNEDEVPLFLISLKAGGTGLNLTGADIVIHYDPWWNLAAQNQATDRAHRIGQKRVVTVYKIIAEDSIEEKIIDMQERKARLADDILDNETVSLFTLSKEELLQLLN